MFGRNAHYILLGSLLDSICKLYSKLWNDTDSQIKLFQQKAEDPKVFAAKITDIKEELDYIKNKMNHGVDNVVRRFRGDKSNIGLIKTEAEKVKQDFLESVERIPPDAEDAFNLLEQLSLKEIDYFKELQTKIQCQIVAEFDDELINLSDKSSLPFESLKPDFTEETFDKIKEETKSKAYETHSYEEGLTFKKTHSYPVYVQNKHFNAIKNNIIERLDKLKNDLTDNLSEFVENIRDRYIKELANNAHAKKLELDAIMEAKKTSEQILNIIDNLQQKAFVLSKEKERANQLKGGILKYVQHSDQI